MPIELRELRIPIDALGPARHGRDGFASDEFGTFYHQYLTVLLPRFATKEELVRAIQEIPDDQHEPCGLSVEKQVEKAMVTAALFHEMRHFHDCFGTLAGVTLFLNHLHVMELFLRACETLRRTGLEWKISVRDWLLEQDCPKEVRLAFREFHKAHLLRRFFLGNVLLPNERGDTTEIACLIVPEGGNAQWGDHLAFPAFPSRVKRRSSGLAPDAVEIALVPLGFETLIEGNAQALQRSLIENNWPKVVADEVWRRMIEVEAAGPHILGSTYLATDLLLTRFLGQRGHERFYRDLVFNLTDRALMQASLFSTHEQAEDGPIAMTLYAHPGHFFLRELEAISLGPDRIPGEHEETQREPDGRSDGKVGGPDWLRMLISSTPPLAVVIDPPGQAPVTSVLRSMVLHEIVGPLLELRGRTANRVFRTLRGYVEHLGQMPRPPSTVLKSSVLSANYVTPAVRERIAEFIFIEGAMNGLFTIKAGAPPIIFCPRAISAFPGAQFYNFEAQLGCSALVAAMACLSWEPGRLTSLPNCGFRHHIGRLRIEVPFIDPTARSTSRNN